VAWIRLEEGFNEHPKILQAGPLAVHLWLSSIAYSNRNLTDGHFPAQLARSGAWALDPIQPERLIQALLKTGLWEEAEGGYVIHNYHKYQPSKEQVLADRAAAKARMQQIRFGRTGRERGKNLIDPVPVPVPVPVSVTDTEPEKKKRKTGRAPFQPPSLAQVEAYCLERGNSVDPNLWLDHYASKGWIVGKSPMRDWQAAVRTWERNGIQPRASPDAPSRARQVIEYGQRMKAEEGR